MYIYKFNLLLPDGESAKCTIWPEVIKGETYFYAKVVGTDLTWYKELPDHEKEAAFGIQVTDGNQNVVYYKNADKLKGDLIVNYGHRRLQSEI